MNPQDRLARLEVRVRRLTVALGITLCALVVFTTAAWKPADKTFEGSHVYIKDKAGNVRAYLGIMANSQPGICFYDGNAAVRAELSIIKTGAPRLILLDSAGKQRVLLTAHQDALVAVTDRKQIPRACLLSDATSGSVIVSDATGTGGAEIAEDGITFADAEGDPRSVFTLKGLAFLEKGLKLRAAFPKEAAEYFKEEGAKAED